MSATISTFSVFFQQATSTPSIRQAFETAAGDDNPAVLSLTMTVLAGSTILVYVTDENFNGAPPGSGAPFPVTISDTQSGSYTNLGYITDPGPQDALQAFTRTNVSAGSITVTCNWVTNQWHGLVVAEVANVGTSPTITFFGNLNVAPTIANDTITTGTHNLGSSPALLAALSYNATDIAPSNGFPAFGTNFTSHLTGWNWNGKEGTSSNNVAQLQSRYLANPGTVAATFTPRGPSSIEDFLAIAVAFQ